MQLVKIAQVDRSHAQLDAAWLALAPPSEAGHAHRVRNGLECHLGPMGHRKLGANKPHKLAQLVGAHNTRASTADAHRHDALAFEHIPKRRHLAHDSFQVLAFGRAVPRQIAPMRIARNLDAKRHVDEQRRVSQRRILSCGRGCHGAFLPLLTPPMQTARTTSLHHPPNRQKIVHPARVNLAQGAPAESKPKHVRRRFPGRACPQLEKALRWALRSGSKKSSPWNRATLRKPRSTRTRVCQREEAARGSRCSLGHCTPPIASEEIAENRMRHQTLYRLSCRRAPVIPVRGKRARLTRTSPHRPTPTPTRPPCTRPSRSAARRSG